MNSIVDEHSLDSFSRYRLLTARVHHARLITARNIGRLRSVTSPPPPPPHIVRPTIDMEKG